MARSKANEEPTAAELAEQEQARVQQALDDAEAEREKAAKAAEKAAQA